MKFRNLRIAWSIMCGIACVLMIVLWIWSFRWESSATVFHQYIRSIDRYLYFELLPRGAGAYLLQFHGNSAPTVSAVAAPYWLLVPLAVALAFAPWIRWRFSLGALIIATTLVAAVLGSAVYLLKH
jgi:hypothetical protein